VVADRRLALPETAMILQQPGRTLVFTESRDPARTAALAARGAEVIRIEDEVFLEACLRHLAGVEEVNELLVEAGAVLAGAMLRAGLVNELIVYQAPVLLGDGGRGLFHLPDLKTMADRIRLAPVETRRVGEDLRCVFRFPGGDD
jgi:diaminohydroxyphosphoribosylaminopyrimidine deaminase/5-amino-6-(5-phosphoribosylamino)uracil reductase